MSTSSSSPSSTPSRDSRRRKPYAQRKTLVRNSSLFGSFKNFVAAPFSRLFSSTEDFDDETDFSGKRRRAAPQPRNDFEGTEDGPAPPKRMRVASPSLSPPANRGSSGGYLDPPSSAFRQKSPHNQTARSTSITIPSTTISDSNNRSTISPLRRQMSSGMSIDSRPSTNTYHRNISRDSPMASVPLVGTADRNTPKAQPNDRPRDLSMPPLSGRPSFIMRSSMTPQPQRDVSEPPPMTSLTSHPVFVRAPSQASERRQKSATPTLGSLVDSQRQSQNSQTASSTRQRGSLLFGRQVQDSQPSQSSVLQELDFYRTPLVPTRLRSKAHGNNTADITDMFNRKRSLILMGDDNRVKLGRRGSRKEKKDAEENESKPYAGTTGLKKRLAKHKQDEEEVLRQSDSSRDDSMMSDKPPATEEKDSATQEIPPPVPPPAGEDFFSLARSSATSSSPQTSSLRVGRASRSHISRPPRPSKTKFSAAYEDDEDVSEESRNEMAALEEAAKKVPVFQVPAGFTFAKDTKPVEVDSTNAKEPPVPSLPFSLTTSASPSFSLANNKPSAPPADVPAFEPTRSASPPRNASEINPKAAAGPTPESSSEGKVPNFFASSKFLSNENTPTPSFSAATPPSNPQPGSGSASPFTLPPPSTFSLPPISSPGLVSAAVPPKETDAPIWQKTDDTTSTSAAAGTSSNIPTMFSFAPQADSSAFGAPRLDAKQQDTAAKPSLSSPFSFDKPTTKESRPPTGISFSVTPPVPATSATTEKSTPSLLFGGPSSNTSIFGNKDASTPASGGSLFSGSNAAPAAGSLFGAPKSSEAEGKKPDSSASGSPFMFGQKPEQPTSLFGSGDKPKSDLFSQPPAGQSTSTSSPFSFSGAPEPPKPAFSFSGQSSAPADTVAPESKPFSFGNSAPAATTPSNEASRSFSFGNGPTTPAISTEAPKPFSFGTPSNPTTPSETSKPFSFGSTSTTTPNASGEPSKGFPFGSGTGTSGTAGASTGFSFGNGPASTPSGFGESKPSFGFGSSRPVTPPPNADQEVRMEESPTRDLQKPSEPRPSLGFSFGSNTSSPFAQSSTNHTPSGSTSSPFSFGGSSTPGGSGFGIKTDVKPASPSFPFGQTQPTSATSTSSPFNFGAAKQDNDPPRPSTTGSFSFSQSPSTTASPFAFGASNNTSNAFGGAQAGSAPGSPSTFSQTPAFGNAGASNPFSFGSQPASPATPSSSLPQSSGFGAPGGGFGASQPSGAGSLFTMGSASPAATNSQGRNIKRLPKRGGKR
ncbi:hypothetical protein AAF712_009787 [Marasmius tenuissimus]|uniref:Uncharacterized protein n=1 Tax=Marasmius tenuissimus TaxID=585030 RepID=A0ABR2ZQ83_9AGAR